MINFSVPIYRVLTPSLRLCAGCCQSPALSPIFFVAAAKSTSLQARCRSRACPLSWPLGLLLDCLYLLLSAVICIYLPPLAVNRPAPNPIGIRMSLLPGAIL